MNQNFLDKTAGGARNTANENYATSTGNAITSTPARFTWHRAQNLTPEMQVAEMEKAIDDYFVNNAYRDIDIGEFSGVNIERGPLYDRYWPKVIDEYVKHSYERSGDQPIDMSSIEPSVNFKDRLFELLEQNRLKKEQTSETPQPPMRFQQTNNTQNALPTSVKNVTNQETPEVQEQQRQNNVAIVRENMRNRDSNINVAWYRDLYTSGFKSFIAQTENEMAHIRENLLYYTKNLNKDNSELPPFIISLLINEQRIIGIEDYIIGLQNVINSYALSSDTMLKHKNSIANYKQKKQQILADNEKHKKTWERFKGDIYRMYNDADFFSMVERQVKNYLPSETLSLNLLTPIEQYDLTRTFDTSENALMRSLEIIHRIGMELRIEIIGYVYRDENGRYRISELVTSFDPSFVLSYSFIQPNDPRIKYVFHNHIFSWAKRLSYSDQNTATALGKSIVVVASNGYAECFDPLTESTTKLGRVIQ